MILTCRPCCLFFFFFAYVAHVIFVINKCDHEASVFTVVMAERFTVGSVLFDKMCGC